MNKVEVYEVPKLDAKLPDRLLKDLIESFNDSERNEFRMFIDESNELTLAHMLQNRDPFLYLFNQLNDIRSGFGVILLNVDVAKEYIKPKWFIFYREMIRHISSYLDDIEKEVNK